MTLNLWGVLFLTAVVSVLAPLIWRPLLVRAGVVDVPNHRSSHSKITLRGGGLAPLTSMFIGGLLIYPLLESNDRVIAAIVLITALVAGLLGLAEDIQGLPVVLRATIQLTVGLFVAVFLTWETGLTWLWVPIVAVFFAANVNFTNFMDGVDGISSLHGFVVGLAFFWLGTHEGYLWLTVIGLLTAVVFIGFLPWNLIPPGMFLGDSGSYLLGGLTGAMAISAIYSGTSPVAALSPLSIYWLDTVSTLLKRALRKEAIFEAHRSHVYQHLAVRYCSHLRAAGVVTVFTVLASFIAGIVAVNISFQATAISLLLLCVVWIGYLVLPQVAEKREANA